MIRCPAGSSPLKGAARSLCELRVVSADFVGLGSNPRNA